MSNTNLTAATITTAQIRDLRAEAQEACDSEQVDVCNHALDASEGVNRTWTVEEARSLCADAINAARASE